MVLNAIFDFGVWLFEFIASAFPNSQPMLYNVANTLSDITAFGVWVIGGDMWIVFMTAITGWLTFKLTWGIILFIYRLIPLI